jgi:membrane protein
VVGGWVTRVRNTAVVRAVPYVVSRSSHTRAAHATWAEIRQVPPRVILGEFKDAVIRHRLLVYATAVAYRGIVAAVPLVLLGLALLGALGLRSTWTNSIAPAVDHHVQKPVAEAIDFSVRQIFAGNSTGLILFATAWVLWNLSFAVLVVMEALNEIHGVRETRSLKLRAFTAAALGAGVGLLLILAVLVMSAAPLINGSPMHLVFGLGRWLVAPALLVLAVTILVRFGPAERPETEWASAGSVFVVLVWLLASGIFLWWVTVANYKSATGNLTVLVTISVYVFITSAIFLFGAQLDELLRKRTSSRN